MHLRLIDSLVLLSLVLSPAYATDEKVSGGDVFVGMNMGYHAANDQSISDNPDSFSYGIYAGTTVHSNLGFDIGYFKNSDMEFNGITVENDSLEVAARYSYPLGTDWELLGRLGVSYWNVDKDRGDEFLESDGFSPVLEAGVKYQLIDNLYSTLTYKYVPEVGDTGSTGAFDSNAVLLGIMYQFESPSDTPTPQPQPVVVEKVVVEKPIASKPVVKKPEFSPLEMDIYFGLEKSVADISELEKLNKKLDFLEKEMKLFPESTLYLTGHSDSSGSRVYNLKTSAQRVQNIQELLEDKGIAPERIVANYVGEQGAALPPDPNDRKVAVKLEK